MKREAREKNNCNRLNYSQRQDIISWSPGGNSRGAHSSICFNFSSERKYLPLTAMTGVAFVQYSSTHFS